MLAAQTEISGALLLGGGGGAGEGYGEDGSAVGGAGGGALRLVARALSVDGGGRIAAEGQLGGAGRGAFSSGGGGALAVRNRGAVRAHAFAADQPVLGAQARCCLWSARLRSLRVRCCARRGDGSADDRFWSKR
eukprot:SAG11_NODE_18104_length_499_cov_7.742500_1_plen_133_part_01